eukprot:4677998-Prymnesium_polylepis.1
MVLDEDKHNRSLGVEYALATLFLIALLLLAVSAEKRHLPASATLIALGAAVGAVLWPGGAADALGLQHLATFDDDVFYFLLLPPVIFEAGFSLQKRPFFRNLGTILLLAVIGTLLTVVVVGQPLYVRRSEIEPKTAR